MVIHDKSNLSVEFWYGDFFSVDFMRCRYDFLVLFDRGLVLQIPFCSLSIESLMMHVHERTSRVLKRGGVTGCSYEEEVVVEKNVYSERKGA